MKGSVSPGLRFGRVMLRPPKRDDAHAIAPWFAETWRDVRGLTARSAVTPPDPEEWLAAGADDGTVRLIEVEDEPLGFVRYAFVGGDCLLHELGVRPQRRNLGFGSEAVFAVEQSAAKAGRGRGIAPVPLANGLAIYFWLRIGYCPRYPGGEPPPGFTLMARDLAAHQAAPPRENGSQTAAP